MRLAVDTNVLVRAVVQDDPVQAGIAAKVLTEAEPIAVIRVSVEAAYLHCAKAFLRCRLWETGAQVERSVLPTAGKMISDQTGLHVAPESREDMVKRYAPDL